MSRTPVAVALDAVERIYNSVGIHTHFTQNYPSVTELLKHNFDGTVAVLTMNGALQIFDLDTYMHCQQGGNNNLKTWADYKDKLQKYLREQLNDDRRLEIARDTLAKYIFDQHYKKFPKWPTVEEKKQQSELFLDLATSYYFETWYIGWACVGHITIQDIREKVDSFYTDFHGRPDLKILFCNERKLRELEKSASSDMITAKATVDEMDQPITFKKLKENLTAQ